MREYLNRLFAHEHWANEQLLRILRNLPAVPPRTHELVGHIMVTHQFWDKRVHAQAIAEPGFWHPLTIDECAALNDHYAQAWPRYIHSLPEPLAAQMVNFIAFDGTPRTFRAVDVLTQLHTHSVHHRAQIMLDMKAAGLEPVNTDYLTYCRKQP